MYTRNGQKLTRCGNFVTVTANAMVFREPSDTAHLMETNNRLVQREANRPNIDTFHRTKLTIAIFKSIELLVTIATLWMVHDQEKLILDGSIKFIFAMLGALIILPLFVMAGLIVGEVPPGLLVWLNRLGTVLFSAVAVLLFYDSRFGGFSLIFSTLMVILYAADTHVSSTMPPAMEVRRRYFRHTHG